MEERVFMIRITTCAKILYDTTRNLESAEEIQTIELNMNAIYNGNKKFRKAF